MKTRDSVTSNMSGDLRAVFLGPYSYIRNNRYILFIISAILIYLIILIRTAWMSDDAYITLRTVDNFVNGYGPVYNITERVQAYTHPLWMFLLSAGYYITNEPYYTTIALSMAISLFALGLYAFKVAPSYLSGTLGIMMFICSKAYIDYSTSGLENPLSHLLLGAYLVSYLSSGLSFRRLLILAFIAALGGMNRMDVLLIYFPSLLYVLYKYRKLNGFLAMLIGFSPFILWELFSIFYYGFPFPNTAYAKLNTGIPAGRMLQQGLYYFADSFLMDPLTLISICIGLVVPFATRNQKTMPISIGVLLYLFYILKIGGDFMIGRFFTIPFFCSVVMITTYKPAFGFRKAAVAFATVVLLGLASPYPNITSGSDYGLDRGELEEYSEDSKPEEGKFIIWGNNTLMNSHDINDERGWYFQFTGLLTDGVVGIHNMAGHVRGQILKETAARLALNGPITSVQGGAGMVGYYAGPMVHIVDILALVDPFLSKLDCKENWTIGHFRRAFPEDYLKTVTNGSGFMSGNYLVDKNLREYYRKLRYIVSGDLSDVGRLKEILKINTGKYDHLLERYNSEIK